MLPWEICHRALRGIRKTVADRLDKSTTLLDKWCLEPTDDGAGVASPYQRCLEFVLAVRSVDPVRAKVLIDYLNTEAGYAPAVALVLTDCDPASMADAVRLSEQNAAFLRDVFTAQHDGTLTTGEAQRAAESLSALLSVALSAYSSIERFLARADDAAESRRIGPKRAPVFTAMRRAVTA